MEELVAKRFVEAAVALGVGEKDELGAAMGFDIGLDMFEEELPPDALALERGVDDEGTEIPGGAAEELVAGVAGLGVHLQPAVNGLAIGGEINPQPSVEEVLEVGGLFVCRGEELAHSGNLPLAASHKGGD